MTFSWLALKSTWVNAFLLSTQLFPASSVDITSFNFLPGGTGSGFNCEFIRELWFKQKAISKCITRCNTRPECSAACYDKESKECKIYKEGTIPQSGILQNGIAWSFKGAKQNCKDIGADLPLPENLDEDHAIGEVWWLSKFLNIDYIGNEFVNAETGAALAYKNFLIPSVGPDLLRTYHACAYSVTLPVIPPLLPITLTVWFECVAAIAFVPTMVVCQYPMPCEVLNKQCYYKKK